MKRLLALSAISLASVLSFHAQAKVVTSDQMTCEQAKTHYFKYGRIYVVASGKDIVPIYGMRSILTPGVMWCSGRGKSPRNFWVPTLENNTCVIAEYCG